MSLHPYQPDNREANKVIIWTLAIICIIMFLCALPYKNLTIHKGKPVVIEGKDTLRVFTTVR